MSFVLEAGSNVGVFDIELGESKMSRPLLPVKLSSGVLDPTFVSTREIGPSLSPRKRDRGLNGRREEGLESTTFPATIPPTTSSMEMDLRMRGKKD